MTQHLSEEAHAVQLNLNGLVVSPEDTGYDAARRVWNAAIDARPALIAACASVADVVDAVAYARAQHLEIAVRGGGHSVGGLSTTDGGLMIDLHRLNVVSVDPASRRAWVQGGALLADLDAATQAHGLATPSGTVGHTGVGGLTLGGGMGWLTRLHGLALDNLIGAQVVLADGRVLHASHTDNPDLFWALRGGGGNFGIVTQFEFALHPIGPEVQLAMLFWGSDRNRAALQLLQESISELPETINPIAFAGLTLPPAPFVPAEFIGRTGCVVMLAGFGDPAELDRAIRRLTVVQPTFQWSTRLPYVELQRLLDDATAWGQYNYDKGAYLPELEPDVIDILMESEARKPVPLAFVELYRLDGAYSAVSDLDTAFAGGRSPRFAAIINAVCSDAGGFDACRDWVRSIWRALRPYGAEEGYINALDATDNGQVRGAYGVKFDRLSRIKAIYDPQNVFHRNANIPPWSSH